MGFADFSGGELAQVGHVVLVTIRIGAAFFL
jgi:hypothetical protein